MANPVINITEHGERESCIGKVLWIKVFAEDYRRLYWREVWDVFSKKYPGKWAVQVFPPKRQLVDSKSVYHLWVAETCPQGLNIRS